MQYHTQTHQPRSVTAPIAQAFSLPFRRLAVCGFSAPGIFCPVVSCLLLLLWPAVGRAQTNAPHSSVRSSRYLLVIEGSRAMRNRAEGTARAIQELIGTGLKGQMRAGDTLGIWTFNDELHTGQIPLQEWAPEGQEPISEKLCSFVRNLHYEKQGRLSNVMPSMLRLVKSSEFITVILISEGSEEIHGTPFDASINKSLKLWTTQQKEAKMPVVTLLRGKRGNLTHYAVAPVPWPIDVPPLPDELQLAKVSTNQPVASAQNPKAPAAPVPSLIVRGKKPEPLLNPKAAEPIANKTNLTLTSAQTVPAAAGTETKSLALSATTNAAVAVVPPATAVRNEPPTPPERTSSRSLDSVLLVETNSPGHPSSTVSALTAPTTNSVPATPQTNTPVVAASGPSSTQPPTPASPDPSSSLPAQMGAVSPGSPLFTVATIAVGTIVLLAVGSLVWFRKRRPSPAAHVSLITRSFEREKR